MLNLIFFFSDNESLTGTSFDDAMRKHAEDSFFETHDNRDELITGLLEHLKGMLQKRYLVSCIKATFIKFNWYIFRNFIIFSGLQWSWIVHVCCLHWENEFRSCARGRKWNGILHYHWWTSSVKPMLFFYRPGYAPGGILFHQLNF